MQRVRENKIILWFYGFKTNLTDNLIQILQNKSMDLMYESFFFTYNPLIKYNTYKKTISSEFKKTD